MILYNITVCDCNPRLQVGIFVTNLPAVGMGMCILFVHEKIETSFMVIYNEFTFSNLGVTILILKIC